MALSDPRIGLKKQSGRVRIEGILFESWRTGVCQSKWVSEDGLIQIWSHFSTGSTYTAAVNQESLNKRFRFMRTAVKAAIKKINAGRT